MNGNNSWPGWGDLSNFWMDVPIGAGGGGITDFFPESPGTSGGPSSPFWDFASQVAAGLIQRVPLPGGRAPLPLPPAGGGLPARLPGAIIAGAARRGLGRYGKVIAVLTAAGLGAEAIYQLIASGAVKPDRPRRRGISAAELRGFTKVSCLLQRYGGTRSTRRRSACGKCGRVRCKCK